MVKSKNKKQLKEKIIKIRLRRDYKEQRVVGITVNRVVMSVPIKRLSINDDNNLADPLCICQIRTPCHDKDSANEIAPTVVSSNVQFFN